MIYLNTKTGAIIDSPTAISGGNWVPESEVHESNTAVAGSGLGENEKTENTATSDNASSIGVNLDSISKKDIMQELDALGVKYNPKDNKATLYALLG